MTAFAKIQRSIAVAKSRGSLPLVVVEDRPNGGVGLACSYISPIKDARVSPSTGTARFS